MISVALGTQVHDRKSGQAPAQPTKSQLWLLLAWYAKILVEAKS